MSPRPVAAIAAALFAAALSIAPAVAEVTLQSFPVPKGAHPHDIACDAQGIVWYTAQHQAALGRLDPKTGKVEQIPLGQGSSPHGVIIGPDGAPWITDSGLNAIVKVDPATRKVTAYPLPKDRGYTNLNTATFDKAGILWFTGQTGVYGSVDPKTGTVKVWDAPKGRGPYGIATTPQGDVYYASLAGSHIARIDTKTGAATMIEPPTANQGARRVWSDSKGRIWVSEWNSGQVSVYDPADKSWRMWKLPGSGARTYSVYVDETDKVWLTDFGNNTMVRFDPATEKFESWKMPRDRAQVRQMLGCKGEAWAPESGTDHLTVFRFK
ncbi:MAG: lyase [Alphaproteobacteria bacterium]